MSTMVPKVVALLANTVQEWDGGHSTLDCNPGLPGPQS